MTVFGKLILCAALGAAWVSQAGVLCWRLGAKGPTAKDAVRALVRVDASTVDVWDGESRRPVPFVTDGGVWCDLSQYQRTDPEYRFAMELVDAEKKKDVEEGRKETRSSGLPQQDGLVFLLNFDSLTPSPFASWNAGGMAVPEPTCGLLLAVGFSVLLLRRRS